VTILKFKMANLGKTLLLSS